VAVAEHETTRIIVSFAVFPTTTTAGIVIRITKLLTPNPATVHKPLPRQKPAIQRSRLTQERQNGHRNDAPADHDRAPSIPNDVIEHAPSLDARDARNAVQFEDHHVRFAVAGGLADVFGLGEYGAEDDVFEYSEEGQFGVEVETVFVFDGFVGFGPGFADSL